MGTEMRMGQEWGEGKGTERGMEIRMGVGLEMGLGMETDWDRDRDEAEPIPHFLQHKREKQPLPTSSLPIPNTSQSYGIAALQPPLGLLPPLLRCPRVQRTRAGSCSLPPCLAHGSPQLPAHSLCFSLSWRSLD